MTDDKKPNQKQNQNNALTDHDIDALADLLDQLSETTPCINLEGLDGVCAALAVMTRTTSMGELMDIVVDDDDTAQDSGAARFSPAQEAALYNYISRRTKHAERLFSNTAISDLSDPRAYHPWVMDGEQLAKTDPEVAAAIKAGDWPELGLEWAVGFISTVEHFDTDWRLEDELLDAELNPMLAPFYALVLPRDEWPDDIKPEDIEGDTREAWLAQAIWACYELWEYWRYHAPKAKGVPHIRTTILGRNDPCDCGSGKKYKQCHGKGEAD